ncbi:MAG: ATP-binding cassette domain-containing protein, partial [Chloroflexota bacterium]|nr:ATP-binding cassette domain-containing protein [Chloroflexota bacterium]
VEKLSGGERQSIAIGRALHFGAKLLILDEPTSALSVAESRKVLTYTLNAKECGLSVIFITHNVHHVYQVADAYTIIRHGKLVGTYNKGELTQDDIADLITGERER